MATKKPARQPDRLRGAGVDIHEIKKRVNAFCEQTNRNKWDLYYFKGNAAYSIQSVFRSPRKVAGFLRYLIGNGLVIIPLKLRNAEIRIKHNIRIFYLDQEAIKLTVKIAASSRGRRGNLAREISARKLYPEFTTPILRYDRVHLHWLEEKAVELDKNVENEVKLKRFLDDYALDFYGLFSRPRPVLRVLKRYRVEPEEVAAILRDVRGAPKVYLEGAQVTCTLVHGDLSPGNMLSAVDGRFYLVDFENMGTGLLSMDLARAASRKNIGGILNIIEKCSDRAALSPLEQMWIAAAIRLARYQKTRKELETRYMKKLNLSRGEAEKKMDALQRKLLNLVNILRDLDTQGLDSPDKASPAG
ncbi:phosphotransferase family protein [Pseudomonadota bacterium]